MKRLLAASVSLVLVAAPSPSFAGVYGDDLSKCFVSSSSKEEKVVLIQWLFAAIAKNPSIEKMAKVTPAEKEALDRKLAMTFETLLLERCRAKALDAVRYEGEKAIEDAFGLIGEVAMREMFNDPATNEAIAAFAGFVSEERMNAFLKEAGIHLADDKAKKK